MDSTGSPRQGQFIDLIAGARPNFMKIASITRALEARRARGSGIGYRLIHTGQHYDRRMSGDFFEQLGIRDPDVNLGVGSGSHAEQTAAIMVGYERLLLGSRPAMCVVVGDVTSTMACAIAAKKLEVPVGHVEAGIRSGDWTMPEEINRRVTDAISDDYFTTSEWAGANLLAEGARPEQVHFVGNTMIDTLLTNLGRLRVPEFIPGSGLEPGKFLVLTLHRPSNVDDGSNLGRLIGEIAESGRGTPVVFPVHPRTAKTLASLGPLPPAIRTVEPQPYLEFIWLVRNSMGVITDSGGITEEATVLGIPCMTLRSTTERPETVSIGTNELLGTQPGVVGPALTRLLDGRWKKGAVPPLWDGRTGERIAECLEARFARAPGTA